MGASSKLSRTFKAFSLNSFACFNLHPDGPDTKAAAETRPAKSLDPLKFDYPIGGISELPSSHKMATSLQPAELVANDSIINHDSLLGRKAVEKAIMTDTLRHIGRNAPLNVVMDVFNEKSLDFQYEACLRELCGGDELLEPNSDSRILLFERIGHIILRGEDNESQNLDFILERHVHDRRRFQNEKYRALQPSNAEHIQHAGNSSAPFAGSFPPGRSTDQNPPASPPQSDFRYAPVQGDERLPSPPESSAGGDDELENMGDYTSRLVERGAKMGLVPKYEERETSSKPKRFECLVTYGEKRAVGRECGSKKAARHVASKVMLSQLAAEERIS
ncbi:hypothetical protein BP6252_02369 [Coleophoma cylindrospora]|uniref:DRBM domain-containing protein n=1 Tax=Coleophoma cylindrospora TaxID=1849047 RepID=A0A3D8SEM6_9HELO|nr:hypothetical protein BP6252_02369 [Coleophoma cylindrospora]